jgi:pimeloyl-ACP methyl ester carboxylesterase
MRPDDVRALGSLVGDAASGVASQARDVHAGIAGRVFGLLGAPAAPVRAVHDTVSAGAYAAARLMVGSVVHGGAVAYGVTRAGDPVRLDASPPGRAVVGAVNGAWGDRLQGRRGAALETPMALRRRGADVPVDSLAAAYPDATGRLAVFLHGLGETEAAWRLRSARSTPYGDRLRTELGYTPLYVRYNSGLHISANGRAFDALMSEVVGAWPGGVSEIALFGHSMGGLVVRGACHYATDGGWRDRVRHIVMLGAPHKGAPLELAANAACHALSALPETRPFAAPLRARSAGVKDLGYGYVVDADWQGHDADAFWTNTGTVVPFLESADHCFVSASLSRDPDHPLGRLIGDLLVLRPSAWSHGGRGERLQFPIDRYTHLGRATHFDLLNHPAVYTQIHRWLTTGRQLPAAV